MAVAKLKVEKPKPQEQHCEFEPFIDNEPRYVTDSLTARKLGTLMQDIDRGDIAAAVELSQEMEAKDANLHGVIRTRRTSYTEIEWCIEPDPRAEDDTADIAAEAADYCQQHLADLRWVGSDGRIRGFDNTLEHLSTAHGPNIAAAELVWNRNLELEKIIDIPGDRLTADFQRSNAIKLNLGQRGSMQGKTVDMTAGKFVVFQPDYRAGLPTTVSIVKASALLFLIKNYQVKDWATFNEVYTMPMRVAKVDQPTSGRDRSKLRNMLKNIGADGWGIFTKSVDIEFIESNKAATNYHDFIRWIEEKQQILWLGQTRTTDSGQSGSFALAKVHDNVRADLLYSDIRKESTMVREQILAPMVRLYFPDQEVPVPMFRRKFVAAKDIEAERLVLDQLRFMKDSGLYVEPQHIYQSFGIPFVDAPVEKKPKKIDPEETDNDDDQAQTVAARVIASLTGWKTAKEISIDTGMTLNQVVGVVHKARYRQVIQVRRIGRAAQYRKRA